MRTVACIGDSLTMNSSLGVNPNEFWPHLLQKGLRAMGVNARCRNWGRSGWTTAETLYSVANILAFEVPDYAIIFLGSNDWQTIQVQASPTPTVNSFSVTSGKGMYLLPGTTVIVNGESRTVLSRNVDAIVLAQNLSGAPAASTAVTLGTTSNLIAIANYLMAAGVPKPLFVGKTYQNISSGADTVGAQDATMAQIRAAQKAASDTLQCPWLGMYEVMRDRIIAGLDVQGSASWHVYDNNTHHNALGEKIIADAILSAMKGSLGVLPTLMWGA